MGGGMAKRLLANGYDLRVYGRDPHRTAPLAALGASVAKDIPELCQNRDLVITMLPSDASLEEVTLGPTGLATSMAAEAVHMVSGTHGIPVMEKLMSAHQQHAQTLVACTVLGRPDRAAEGKLGLIPAGPSTVIERITPMLKVLGETLFSSGENPLSSVAVKIANNFVLGCAIEAMGEGMSLVRKYGVDPLLFYEVLTKGLFNCVAYQGYGHLIATQNWGCVGATATIGLKDIHLALEAAEKVSVPLPSGEVWRAHLSKACDRGEASLDWAVMAREQFRNSGLE